MKKFKKIILTLIIASILSFFFLILVGKKINPIIKKYIDIEVKRFTTKIISNILNKTISKEINNNLVIITRNNNLEIEMIDYDTKEANKILSKVTEELQERLLNLEDGNIDGFNISNKYILKDKNGIVCEIPFGSINNNALLNNIGPLIPIKLTFSGQVQSNLETKIKSYGINYVFLEINIKVVVEEQVTMPLASNVSNIEVTAPIVLKLINGKIPNYYLNDIEKNSEYYTVS